MTIYKDDIKLYESKVMTDESDGGGAMSGVLIESGEHNSIFPDISDLDRAYGVVNLRSVHLKVDANTDESYYGATVGLVDTPEDPNVEVTLMSVNDPYIERDETRDLIERYLTKAAKYQGELLYTQLEGQRMIRLIQRDNIGDPIVGGVLVLVNRSAGVEQYVKIEEVKSEVQPFAGANGSYSYYRKIITCVITEPLRFEFAGVNPSASDPTSAASSVYDTMVADAAKYYGLKTLSADAAFNKSALKVDSIFTQLVPSTRVDSPHINKNAVNLVAAKFDMGGGQEGELVTSVESKIINVDLSNQGYIYTATLVPIPSKGTTKVSYMSQGNWYELQDDGTGVLRGTNEAFGTGQLDELGNLMITTGALPDVDIPILIHYQNVNNYIKRILPSDLSVEDEFTILIDAIMINSHHSTIKWGSKTATINDSVVSGDMTGKLESAFNDKGEAYHYLKVKFAEIPDRSTAFDISWDIQVKAGSIARKTLFTTSRTVEGGMIYLPANLPPRSLKLTVNYPCPDSSFNESSRGAMLRDDGEGNLIAGISGNPIAGTINYATGQVVFGQVSIPFTKTLYKTEKIYRSHYLNVPNSFREVQRVAGHQTTSLSTGLSDGSGVGCIGYDQLNIPQGGILAGTTVGNFVDEHPLIVNVDVATEILKDTLAFTYNSREYESRGDTAIFSRDVQVGTVDLDTGIVSLHEWGAGNGLLSLSRGAVKTGILPQTQYSMFRTAGSPVASQSLQVNAVDFEGKNINATTDANGLITSLTGDFEGTINTKIGVVELIASGLLDTSNIKYNCVSYNYLPLDADQLGLDPIRLPSDGRVVIFEKGDVIVVHQDEAISVTVTTGKLLDLEEVRLSSCTTSATDAIIDLDAGTILFPTAGTYDIAYRFEDMVLLTYVDISGSMKTSRPLSHDYTEGKAKVASLLIAGDLFARYTNLYDQKTWTGVFSDRLIGSEAPVEYNDTLCPIEVTDDGCITERMAIVFTSSTEFKLIGENIGQISVGNINDDFAPINPISGKPYFTLKQLGWGDGWATNNALRIDFYGAVYQFNVIRTILQGESDSTIETDDFALQMRGNVNKEVI